MIEKEKEILKIVDYPGIIKYIEYFEDLNKLYLIFEYVSGGELYDVISKNGSLPEKRAAVIFRQLLLSINYLHSIGVCHRDIKLENCLVMQNSSSDKIKLIDFGLAVKSRCEYGAIRLHQVLGTTHYMAPEVLRQNYNEKCDLWSAGVCLFALVTGGLPFGAPSETGIKEMIQKGIYGVPDSLKLSIELKELMKNLICIDETKRFNAEMALGSSWFDILNLLPTNDAVLINYNDIYSAFLTFQKVDLLKKIILLFIAYRLSDEKIMNFRQIFKSLANHSAGSIGMHEVEKIINYIQNSQLFAKEIIQSLDLDKNNCINYTEFVAAMLPESHLITHEIIQEAFQYFDANNDGKVSVDDLRQILLDKDMMSIMSSEVLLDLVIKYDKDHDGMLNYAEFSLVFCY